MWQKIKNVVEKIKNFFDFEDWGGAT